MNKGDEKELKKRLFNRIKDYKGFANRNPVKAAIGKELMEEATDFLNEIDERDKIH